MVLDVRLAGTGGHGAICGLARDETSFYLEAWAGGDSHHTDDRIGRGTIDCEA
jgi:hypothetical protein